jgi:hypothetical protein
MRQVAIIVCLSSAFSPYAMAADKPHPHRAMARPGPAAHAGCLDRNRLSAEHTAYMPEADVMPPRCGRLLSTDTLVSARHWDQT